MESQPSKQTSRANGAPVDAECGPPRAIDPLTDQEGYCNSRTYLTVRTVLQVVVGVILLAMIGITDSVVARVCLGIAGGVNLLYALYFLFWRASLSKSSAGRTGQVS